MQNKVLTSTALTHWWSLSAPGGAVKSTRGRKGWHLLLPKIRLTTVWIPGRDNCIRGKLIRLCRNHSLKEAGEDKARTVLTPAPEKLPLLKVDKGGLVGRKFLDKLRKLAESLSRWIGKASEGQASVPVNRGETGSIKSSKIGWQCLDISPACSREEKERVSPTLRAGNPGRWCFFPPQCLSLNPVLLQPVNLSKLAEEQLLDTKR